eukprot:4580923-Amphidinium_carterae.1
MSEIDAPKTAPTTTAATNTTTAARETAKRTGSDPQLQVQPAMVGNSEDPEDPKTNFERQASDYQLEKSFAVSWKDLSYTVQTKKGDKTILSQARLPNLF